MGLNMNQAFPSKYLSAQDVTEQGTLFRIQSVTMEQVDQDLGKPQKPIVHFQGQDKGMVLNVTNNNTIMKMYGADSDGWVGRDVVLFKTFTEFRGDMVEAIRVRPGIPAAQAPAAGQAPTVQPVPATAPAPAPVAAPAVPDAAPLPGHQAGDPGNWEA